MRTMTFRVVIGDSLVKSRLKVDNIAVKMIESGKEAIIQGGLKKPGI